MSGTFPVAVGPTQSATRSSSSKVLRAEFGDGYTQRAGDGLNNVRDTYALSWEGLTRSDVISADTFLRARGGWDWFYWTPPGGTQRKWVCSEWQVRHSTATLDSLSATFVEVFDL